MISHLFLQKIVLSILIGALLGLEREYTKKQEIVGLRTFSLISLLGCLSVILSQELFGNYLISIIAFVFVCLFAVGLYLSGVLKKKRPGFTTNMAVIIAYMLGLLVGLELFMEAIFLGIVVAIILFSRERLHRLVEHLTEKEVGDLLEFLVLLGIVYPILPENIILYGITIPIFMIWLLAVVISLINFGAFLGARYFGPKQEVGIISFFGGLISSTISVASLINLHKENKRLKAIIVPGFLIITGAALLRNFALVMIPAPETAKLLLLPLCLGAGSLFLFSYILLKKKKRVGKIHISSPFNVPKAIKLGIVFLGLFIVLDVAQQFGSGVFFAMAFLGGMLSSTGVSISIVSLLMGNVIGIIPASMGLILSNMGSVLSNYTFCYINKSPGFFKSMKYVALSFIIMVLVLGLLIWLI